MTRTRVVISAFAVVAACGFPRPPHVEDDTGDPPGDANVPPGISIHVAGTGDDNNDGVSQPIKTLKHAFGLAAANTQITSIVLASGRYSTAGGETFPYTVPANIAIIGPAGGGAILAGSNTEPGLIVGSGSLRDLEFEDFLVAVAANGVTRITNVHIRTKTVGLRGEMSAAVMSENLDISGALGACATGIELAGDADLSADHLATRGLGIAANAQDQSTLTLSTASLAGDSACKLPNTGVVTLSTTKTFVMMDSVIDGGGYNGVLFAGATDPARAMITNSTIKNVKQYAAGGLNYVLDISGGEISGCSGIGASQADIKMTGVTFRSLTGLAADLGQGGSFVMRNCMVQGELMYLNGDIAMDLGTSDNPGQNSFQQGGLSLEAGISITVYAAGNTWLPSIQGADGAGHYATALIRGPATGRNYSIYAGASIQL